MMNAKRIEEMRNKIGLDAGEACEVLDYIVELQAKARIVVERHDAQCLAPIPGDSESINGLRALIDA